MKSFMVEDHMVLVNEGSQNEKKHIGRPRLLPPRCLDKYIEDLWGFDLSGTEFHSEI